MFASLPVPMILGAIAWIAIMIVRPPPPKRHLYYEIEEK